MYRVMSIAVLMAAGFFGTPAAAQEKDVTFFVVGKAARFFQDEDKHFTLWRYHVFAEVFLTSEGKLSKLSVTLPGPDGTKIIPDLRPTKSKLVNDVYKFDGIHFQSEAAMDRMVGNGVFTIYFDTPSGNVHGRTVTLEGAGVPPSPVVSLFQGDREISPKNVDPEQDLVVRWSEWPEGAADPSGILDDLVFVAAHHCNRDYAIHSGRPFEGTDFLTFRDREFRIQAAGLEPGRVYTMFVEFADLVDTNRVGSIEGLATYTNQTYVDFHTHGEARHVCPQ